MIWHHDHRVDDEWVSLPCAAECLSQQPDVVDEQRRATVREIDGEEIGGARDESASIVGHSLTS